MKRKVLQLFVLLLLSASGFSSAQNQSAESAERAEAGKLAVEVVRLYNAGKYDEAIPLAKRAVALKEKILGKENPSLADSLNNLGALYMAKKDYFSANNVYKRALSIYEKAQGKESPALCVMLDKLAWIHYALGGISEAQKMLERTLSIKEKTFGKESAEVGQALVYLAQFYEKQGKYKQAIPFYQRAVEVLEKSGATDTFQAEVASKCACAMTLNKQTKEAEEYEKRAFVKLLKTGEIPQKTEGSFGGVLAGGAIFRQKPEYPPGAKQERVSGSVVVQVTVDESGKVTNARTLCGHDYFAKVSEKAALQWRFSPTLLNGIPVKVIGTITFNFTI